MEKQLSLQIFSNPQVIISFVVIIITLSFLSGILPALIISKISPIHIFEEKLYLKISGKNYRSALTMFQFTVSIILISALIVITRQIEYVKHKDLGFKTEHLLDLKVHYTLANRTSVLAKKLRQYHSIKSITETFGVPGEIDFGMGGYSVIMADKNTINTFGFNLLQGRNFLSSDSIDNYVIINEAALKELGGGDYKDYKISKMKIAGVVSDFNYSSMHKKIEPLILKLNNGFYANNITMRISGPVGRTIDYVKKTWEEICPDYPIQFGFYDDYFDSMYRKEENLASLISIFSILAVVISCLGIFGLAVFQSEQRIKEIGIRKVFGASSGEIIFLLTKNISVWVVIANIIAIPVAYYFLNKWLQEFAYRINI